MTVNMKIGIDGKISISTGSAKIRKEDLNKWLIRNDDALLVKLNGYLDQSSPCSVGHICHIEKADDNQYYAFIGNHLIGQLPNEAITFADSIDSSPEYLISIVGKIEPDAVYIYIAE